MILIRKCKSQANLVFLNSGIQDEGEIVPTGSGNFIHYSTLQSYLQQNRASIHNFIFWFWKIWSIHSTFVIKTLDTTDSRCKFTQLRLLFQWTGCHQITSWNLLISSHLIQSVIRFDTQLCWPLTSISSSNIHLWTPLLFFKQTCSKAEGVRP